MERLLEKFKEFGFTKYEALTYLTLLAYGSLTARGISRRAQIPYNRTYEVLASLIEKGFVQELEGKSRTFTAVEPDVAFYKYSKALEQLKEDVKRAAKNLRVEEREYAIWRFSSPEEVIISLKNMMKDTIFEFTLLAPNNLLFQIMDELKGLLKRGVTLSVYTDEGAELGLDGNVFVRITEKTGHIIALSDIREVLVSPSLAFDTGCELPSGFKSNFPEILFSYYIYIRDVFNSSKLLDFNVESFNEKELRFVVCYHITQVLEKFLNEGFEVKAEIHTTAGDILEGNVVGFIDNKVVNSLSLDINGKKVTVGGPFSIIEEYEERGTILYPQRRA